MHVYLYLEQAQYHDYGRCGARHDAELMALKASAMIDSYALKASAQIPQYAGSLRSRRLETEDE
jgi:hypothetical protein